MKQGPQGHMMAGPFAADLKRPTQGGLRRPDSAERSNKKE